MNCRCVQCVGYVLLSGDNLASGGLEGSYIISNYSSLIDVRVIAFRPFMVSFA